MQNILQNAFKKQDQSHQKNKKMFEKNKEIYDLFVRAASNEEIQKLERWLLR